MIDTNRLRARVAELEQSRPLSDLPEHVRRRGRDSLAVVEQAIREAFYLGRGSLASRDQPRNVDPNSPHEGLL